MFFNTTSIYAAAQFPVHRNSFPKVLRPKNSRHHQCGLIQPLFSVDRPKTVQKVTCDVKEVRSLLWLGVGLLAVLSSPQALLHWLPDRSNITPLKEVQVPEVSLTYHWPITECYFWIIITHLCLCVCMRFFSKKLWHHTHILNIKVL